MALVRWSPSRELDTLPSDFDRLFDAFFQARPLNGNAARRWIPAMDLVETADELVLRADLPGMKEDDVEIEIKDGVLNVSGERRSEHEDKNEGYYRVERSFGSFSRSLSLPDGIDAEQVKANFEDGVLEVHVPKPAETKPHRVQIDPGNGSVEGSGTEKK